jgi:hypothetical protein
MNVPTKPQVDDATREVLAGLTLSDPELLLEGLEARNRRSCSLSALPYRTRRDHGIAATSVDEFAAAKARLLSG